MSYRKIEGLNFQPWVGKNYEQSEYGRLLILGESHYTYNTEVEDNFTSNVIKDFLYKNVDIAFYRNLGYLFNPEDKHKIWEEVAFANLIQNGLDHAESQPNAEDIATIDGAFHILLKELKPDKILVCSKRLWNHWIPEKNGSYVQTLKYKNKQTTTWEYTYHDKTCTAMGIQHPSKYFSTNVWRPFLDDFLGKSNQSAD